MSQNERKQKEFDKHRKEVYDAEKFLAFASRTGDGTITWPQLDQILSNTMKRPDLIPKMKSILQQNLIPMNRIPTRIIYQFIIDQNASEDFE